jgi:tetratricopeptide (TPR) repeat protein
LEQLAPAGGVVVQGAVSEAVPTRFPFIYENLGEQALKGFDRPVRAFLASRKPGVSIPAPESIAVSPPDSGRPAASGTINVVGAIEPELTRAEWERAKTKNPENLDAWDYVVRAIALTMEFSDEGSAEAMRLLERAIALDPRYARAYGHKAWLAIWRALQGWDEVGAAIEVATIESGRGIQLDVNEPWSYIARTFIGFATRDSDLSLSSSRKAIELSPNFAYGHSVHGLAFALAGRAADGLGEIELAMRSSPRDISREEFELHYAFAQFQTANYEEAARFAESASLPRPGHVYPQLLLMASYGHLGQMKKGQQVLQRLRNCVPGFSLTAEDVVQIYVSEEDHGRLLDGLDKAGVLKS